ncbi:MULTISPECIES: DUF389 domain-containing protein [Zunongwangia]|jgi:uncharacterized hydrophobic protein (TIGR00271 family)|uniref:DUF389 domain-containing protein n=1 Tax=Zunongwangia TaxID=417127 RepID=UPI001D186FC2|nr:DUF389 domain-containing protein [Zunongwangia profunda]MCC4230830.1 DUF389 domain-containing protein [Zunongwangia profunda]|tara:strand:+ start:7928 stop:9346 length:1419 start_codon:yes stop_codon:yes gene_type:complete
MEKENDNLEKNEEYRVQAKGFLQSTKIFINDLLDIRTDSDRESTLEAVRKDISFKGHNAWILIFSIFVASIGLNVSSTAVVIGAMLISPLMGPIVGVGMSVAINDVDTLRKSIKNLGIMVVLSVLTAFIYFKISPVTEITPELEARTYPTILDVLVAIFGGLALIVGKSKKGTIASVIMGVAIATALMPPLCTVGFGLANSQWQNAGGAFYLFSINAVFIALSTFAVTKLLGFPLVRYANSKSRRRTAQVASAVAVIVMIPSIILFINLLNKTLFETKAKDFVSNDVRYLGAEVLKQEADFDEKTINIYLIGKRVPEATIATWRSKLIEIEALKESKLIVHQSAEDGGNLDELSTQVRSGILEDLYLKNREVIEDKDSRIKLLEDRINSYRTSLFDFNGLSKEAQANYEEIENLGYSNQIITDFKSTDTIPTFSITWKNNVSSREKEANRQKFEKWLNVRLQLDTLTVQSLN